MSSQTYQDIGHQITRIDTHMTGTGMAACYLMQQGDAAAIIETGTHHTVPIILDLLAMKSIAKEQVRYVIPTHVHLDHAGGVGGLMQALPKAELVIHPKGARHMIDPAKLKAGAEAVYGEKAFAKVYGDVIPVAEERVRIQEDNTELDLNGRTLRFYDTPGHARHHFCVADPASNGIFTGDTFGLSYPSLPAADGPFLLPTTTPVQFEPEALKQSIQRLIALKPDTMYLTHFGPLHKPEQFAPQLLEQIDDYVAIAKAEHNGADPSTQLEENINQKLTKYTLQRLRDQGCPLDPAQQRKAIEMDMQLNSQGLAVWLQRQTG